MSTLLWGLLLCFCHVCLAMQPRLKTQQTTVELHGTTPTPTPWPHQFHATLFQNRTNQLAIVDLYYDWTNGRNLNLIRSQQGARGTLYDVEYNNKTSFYFDRSKGTCKQITFEVGILVPNWLDGAQFLGTQDVDNFTAYAFTKEDFITYYEDVTTHQPVRWFFHTATGQPAQFEVMSWDVGGQASEQEWQAPQYCFQGHHAAGGVSSVE